MRILVATDQWYPDLFGGVARMATETATRLANAGHEVVVLAPRIAGAADDFTTEGTLTVARVLPRTPLPATVSDASATRRWARRLADRRFDVLVAHSCNTAYGLLRARLGRPLLYVFHSDTGREQAYLASLLPPGRARVTARALELPLRRFEDIAIREAHTIVVLSSFSRQLLRDRSPAAAQRATLISGAVDTSAFTPVGRVQARRELGLDRGERVVFTVRRLVPRMGLDNLIDAVALLPAGSDLRIAIAGTGELDAELRARADRLGLAERLRFLGRVADAELPLWHRAADLFVLPTAAYEGFGLVTAEALASGTPVVGTPVGATPELLEPIDPRLVAAGTDAASLAAAIEAGLALATDELRARCRAVAVERFSWDAVMPEWEQALQQAAAAPATPARKPTVHRTVLETAAGGVRWSGAPVIARRVNTHERAGIVVYHDPSPDIVERHLTALSRHHRFVTLDEVVSALRENEWGEIPPKAIAITIDDGFARNADLAEVFTAFGVVPTVFLCPTLIESGQPFWWTLPGLDVTALKRVPNEVRLAAVEQALETCPVPGQALSPAEIASLGDRFVFGSHTSTHPILPMCTDAEAQLEIQESRAGVQRLTGLPCLHLAFPNGDFGPRELRLAREAGYRSSRTTKAGWVQATTDPFCLPCLPMPDDASANRAVAQVALATLRPGLLDEHKRLVGSARRPRTREQERDR